MCLVSAVATPSTTTAPPRTVTRHTSGTDWRKAWREEQLNLRKGMFSPVCSLYLLTSWASGTPPLVASRIERRYFLLRSRSDVMVNLYETEFSE